MISLECVLLDVHDIHSAYSYSQWLSDGVNGQVVASSLTYLHLISCGNFPLTLRLLMLYIYMQHLFLMFLDHTQRRSTVGRTPLDE